MTGAHGTGAAGVSGETGPAAAGDPVFILGSPRSGTTWLGKLFDSHPAVRYIHEPEIAFPPVAIPVFTPDGAAHAAEMARLVALWRRTWHPRSRATVPVFAKSYRAGWRGNRVVVHAARAAYHVLDRGLGAKGLWPALPEAARGLPVMKGVNLLGRVPALLAACPGARIVHVIRHPCAQVASLLRQRRAEPRRVPARVPVSALPSSRCAARLGLDAARLDAATDSERAAWQWLCFNDDVAALDDPRILTIAYDGLVTDPEATLGRLFTFAGLDLPAQTRAYLERRAEGGDRAGRYSLARDPQTALNRWRRELSPEDQAAILDIAQATPMAARLGFVPGSPASAERS